MKLRILIYGFLILLICLLATVYLVYSNQDRLLEVARFKLSDLAREKWGMEMEVGLSELSLHRNAVSFRNLTLVSAGGDLSVKVGLLEMVYSLRKLIRGEVFFEKIFLERPDITLTLSEKEGARPPGSRWPVKRILAGVAVVGRVDVEQGTFSLIAGEGGKTRLALEGLGVQVGTSRGALASRLWAEKMTLDEGPYHGLFREIFLQGQLDEEGFSVGKLVMRGDAGPLRAQGRVAPDGNILAEFAAEVDLESFRYSLEEAIPMAGTVSVEGRLAVDSGGWRVEGRARNSKLEIWGHLIPDASSTVRLVPGRCTFSDIAALPRRGGGRVSGQGELNWQPGEFGYAFVADIQGTRPNDIGFMQKNFGRKGFSDFGPLEGQVTIQGMAVSGGSWWSVLLDVAGPAERFFGAVPVRVKGTIRSAKGQDVALKDFSVRSGDLAGSFAGVVGQGGALDIAFLAETDNLSRSLEPFGLEWIGGTASATGDISGLAENFVVTGGVTAESVTVRGVPFQRAWGRIRYQEDVVALEQLSLTNDGSTITVDGSFETVGEFGFDASALLKNVSAKTAAALLGVEPDVEGYLGGEVAVQGTPRAFGGSGRLESARLEVAGQELHDALAEFVFDRDGADFSTLRTVYRDTDISFEGRVETSGRIGGTVMAAAATLASFLPDAGIGGGAVIEGSVEGTWPAVDFTGTATWKEASLAGKGFPDTVAEVIKRGDRVTARGRLLGRFPAQAELAARRPFPLEVGLSFQGLKASDLLPVVGRWGPPALERLLTSLEGTADGSAQVRLDLAQPAGYMGTLHLERLEVLVADEVSRLRRPAEVFFSGEGFSVDRLAFEGDNHRFTAGGRTESGALSWQLDGTVDLGLVSGRLPMLDTVDLKPDISVSIGGTVASPRITGDARLSGGRVALTGFQAGLEQIEAEVGFNGDRVTLRRLEARVGSGNLRGTGSYRLADNTMGVVLEGSVSLAELGRQLPGIREYDGAAVFTAEVNGPWNRPGYRAEVAVTGGRLRPSGLRVPLEDLTARVSVVDEHFRLKDLSARINGGMIRGAGYLVLPGGGEIEEVNLDLVAEKIYVSMDNTLKVVSSGDLNLAGTPENYLLKGRVALERGKYFKDMTPRPMINLLSESREALADPGLKHPFLAGLGLDIRILAEEGFWIDNNVAQINTGLDVRVRGTPVDPYLSGEVEVREGTVYYLGKRFTLEQATFSFQERRPPDPYVNIEATTVISGVDITLLVNGNLSLLSLDFFSDPPYSREDIVSLLTLGAPRSQLDNRGREISALGAMMVFSGPLLTRIEDEARDFTGLEVFQIEPTLSDTGGAARLVMGKRLSDRIFVSYSRGLTSTGDEQFSMKYELFDFLYLVGQQDRGSTYSFDLVFSLGGD